MDAPNRARGGEIVVYDGDCSFCRGSARFLVRMGAVEESRARSWQSFEGAESRGLLDAGIRNELLVIDGATGAVRGGFDAILGLLRGTALMPLAWVLGLPGIRSLARALYRFVAFNRRILFPPGRGIACACDPDPHPGATIALVVVGFALFLLGAPVAAGPLLSDPSPTPTLVASLWAWLPSLVASIARPAGTRLLHVAHLAAVAGTGGTLLLALGLLARAFEGGIRIGVAAAAVAAALVAMGRSHRRHLAFQGLGRPGWWTWVAGMAAASAALAILDLSR